MCLGSTGGYRQRTLGNKFAKIDSTRRGGRVAEGARLESVYTGNRIAGSNPVLSAKFSELIDPIRLLELCFGTIQEDFELTTSLCLYSGLPI